MSYPTYQAWYKDCQNGESTNSVACTKARAEMNTEVGNNIDPYALDYPVCHGNGNTFANKFWFLKTVVNESLGRPMPGYYQKVLESKIDNDIKYDHTDNYKMAYEPCESNWLTEYLNQKSVQSAIHAKPTTWRDCGGISYSFASEQNPMEPTWKWLFTNAPSVHYTIVSGDDDSVCGTLGTQSWIYDLGYEIEKPWSAWTDESGQNGGYLIKFKDALSFVTVHSAGTYINYIIYIQYASHKNIIYFYSINTGHMIPETQPSRSLQSFKRYLSGEF